MNKIYYTKYDNENKLYDNENEIDTILQKKEWPFMLGKMKIDDLLLVAVIVILITEEKPDILTIIALAYVFIA